jgi:hypothetical protein
VTVLLTTLVFDGSYDDTGFGPDVVTTALAGDGAPHASPASALLIRWGRTDHGPRCRPLTVPGGLPAVLELVFAATFLLPLLQAATQQPARAGAFPLDALGLDLGFANQLRDTVVPGTWALLLLATVEQVDEVAESTVPAWPVARIETALTPIQLDAIWRAYGDETDDRQSRLSSP